MFYLPGARDVSANRCDRAPLVCVAFRELSAQKMQILDFISRAARSAGNSACGQSFFTQSRAHEMRGGVLWRKALLLPKRLDLKMSLPYVAESAGERSWPAPWSRSPRICY